MTDQSFRRQIFFVESIAGRERINREAEEITRVCRQLSH